MAAGNANALGFHLFVTLLAFSCLISSVTSRAMLVRGDVAVLAREDASQNESAGEALEMAADEFSHGRMDFEINRDYLGSGPNNRHTPVPQVKD